MIQLKVKEFVNSKKKIYVYGTGKRGRGVRAYIKHYLREIDGWLVSDGRKTADVIDGVPVYECSSLQCNEEDGVVIGVSKEFYEDVVEQILANSSIKNVCFTDREYDLGRAIYYLEKNNVDISANPIDLGSFQIPNLFHRTDDMAVFAYSIEMLDLVLPYIGDETCLVEGSYEYEKCVLNEGDVVIDCGANVGLFSARAAAVGCKVYAFEPQPPVQEYLNMTKELYNEQIEIVQYALADYEGDTEFTVCDAGYGVSGMVIDREGMKIKVPVTTIDAFVQNNHLEKVDFIKADIEGAERLMLQGAVETMKKYAPKLSICTYHLHDDILVLTDIIREANPNYKICYNWEKLYAWVE